jgi:hypothetical protein
VSRLVPRAIYSQRHSSLTAGGGDRHLDLVRCGKSPGRRVPRRAGALTRSGALGRIGPWPRIPTCISTGRRLRRRSLGHANPGAKGNASGARQLPQHSKSESFKPWRLLGGPACASLPNSSESTPGQYSGSAALSTVQASPEQPLVRAEARSTPARHPSPSVRES